MKTVYENHSGAVVLKAGLAVKHDRMPALKDRI